MNIWQLGSMHYFRPSSYIERNIAKMYLWQVSSYPSYSDLGDNDRWEKFINAIDKNTVDINSMKQNKTSLIVDDFTGLLGRHNCQVIDDILKNRGVKKWFLVRRLIIKLKDRWKAKINTLELMKKQAKKHGNYKEYLMLESYQKCLIDCRQQMAKINILELMKKQAKKHGNYKEYLMLESYQNDCRQQIRALCNIPRELEDLTLPNGFEWRRPNKNYFRKREVK